MSKKIENTAAAIEDIQVFFPEYRGEEEGQGPGPEYLLQPDLILPYLQTLFLEERLIGVQIEQTTRSYNTTLWDHPPEMIEEEIDGETVLTAPEYERGSYLKQLSHINLAPLEPAAGNMLVRGCSFMLLIFYSGTTSVEIGVRFKGVGTIRGDQVIQCHFPQAARIVRNCRPFRAKSIKDQDLFVQIRDNRPGGNGSEYTLVDLSAAGLSFGCQEQIDSLENGSFLKLLVDARSDDPIEASAMVRNCSKVRTKGGTLYVYGVMFDLETRALAAAIEKKFALMQRTFIRSLKEETESLNIDLKLA